MRPIKKIAMIGATGMLGIPVALALMEAGFEVTALVRDAERARRVLPAPIALVDADVRDEESLRKGLKGQDGLYLNLSVTPGARRGDYHTEVQGLENIIAAARDAKVERLVYVSALVQGTEHSRWWVIDVWRQALARIKSSGIAYTVFYPTNFMETLAQRHTVGRRVVMLGRARHRNYWIAGRDFGAQVARAFALPQAASREFVIQGPEALTYDEAAVRYAASLPEPKSTMRVPLWLVRLGGLFSGTLDYDARIMDTVLSYPEEFKASDTWAELGKPTTTIEQFAKRQLPTGA
jgi:uncharacterized protein YbjT (DUF2867 family)